MKRILFLLLLTLSCEVFADQLKAQTEQTWKRTAHPDGSVTETRITLDPDDGKGPWTQYRTLDPASPLKIRTYSENGVEWEETIQGDNRYRYRAGGHKGLCEEAKRQGAREIVVPGPEGPLKVEVYGNLDDKALDNLKTALCEMPLGARPHLSRLFVCSQIGEQTDLSGKNPQAVAGLGSSTLVIVDRKQLDNLSTAKDVLYHEAGHARDQSQRPDLSSAPPWGTEPRLPGYAGKNNLEEFAEVHRQVMLEWDKLEGYDAKTWADEPFGQKKHHIFTIYGGSAPAAETIWPSQRDSKTQSPSPGRLSHESGQ